MLLFWTKMAAIKRSVLQRHISRQGSGLLGKATNLVWLCCRDKWLFTSNMRPAQQAHMAEAAAPSEIFGDPFKWEPQPVAPFDFEMQDGVFRVFDRSGAEPFQLPGNSFDFFSDMSRSVLTCSSAMGMGM